jgi:hypothetical protein
LLKRAAADAVLRPLFTFVGVFVEGLNHGTLASLG